MKAIELTTVRLLLDQPTLSDVVQITTACQEPVFEKFMTLPWPYKASDAAYFVQRFVPDGWESGREATWALRPRAFPTRLVGMVGIRAATPDVGYWLVPEHRGNGYMAEALERTISWALETNFGGGSHRKLPHRDRRSNYVPSAGKRLEPPELLSTASSKCAEPDSTSPDSWPARSSISSKLTNTC